MNAPRHLASESFKLSSECEQALLTWQAMDINRITIDNANWFDADYAAYTLAVHIDGPIRRCIWCEGCGGVSSQYSPFGNTSELCAACLGTGTVAPRETDYAGYDVGSKILGY